MTPFVARRRVEFCDTDLAGMMHFGNFFRFMEFAEQEFLRTRGLSVVGRDGDDEFGFPRVSATCDYRKPARFEQVLDIAVTLKHVGAKSVTFEFDFRHAGEQLARGAMTSVCCRVAGGVARSIPIPEAYRAALVAGPPVG
jgi:YbgC/YbaW family acyl-CoA thioester hydrolase